MSPAAIIAIVQLAATYGPPLVNRILELWKKQNPGDPTIDEWIALFKDLKPYEAYGIPAVIPPK